MKQVWAAEISTHNLSQVIKSKLQEGLVPSHPVFGNKRRGMEELFVLQTGSQFVVFGVGDSMDPLLNFFIQEPELFQNCHFHRTTEASANLLFAIASGLCSTIKGGSQALADLQYQFYIALQCGGVGLTLDGLIREAIRVGKKVRSATGLEHLSNTLFDATLDLVLSKLSNPYEPSVLVIGEGDVARNSLDFFLRAGIKNVTVATRHSRFGLEAQNGYAVNLIDLEDIKPFFHLADVVVNEGSSLMPHKKDLAHSGEGQRKVILDFSQCNPFEEYARVSPMAMVYTPDDIQTSPVVYSDMFNAADGAWRMVEEEAKIVVARLSCLDCVPVLDFIWNSIVFKREQEISFLLSRVINVSEFDEQCVQRFNNALLKTRRGPLFESNISRDEVCSAIPKLQQVSLNKLALEALNHLN